MAETSPDLAADRQRLLELLARDAFRLGTFKLASGGTSDYYLDCRVITLSPLGCLLTARLMLAELLALAPPPEAVGGLTMGADPIVAGVALESARGATPITGFLVRKTEKAHGMGRKIEGVAKPGWRVAIVDDVCTTAGSTVQAIESAWEAKLDVAAVRCLVEREEAGGRANLERLFQERLGQPCPFKALFTAREVRAAHEAQLAAGKAGAQ